MSRYWLRISTRSLRLVVAASGTPMPRDAVPVFETCWAVLTALSILVAGFVVGIVVAAVKTFVEIQAGKIN